jgi:hypothetical protein
MSNGQRGRAHLEDLVFSGRPTRDLLGSSAGVDVACLTGTGCFRPDSSHDAGSTIKPGRQDCSHHSCLLRVGCHRVWTTRGSSAHGSLDHSITSAASGIDVVLDQWCVEVFGPKGKSLRTEMKSADKYGGEIVKPGSPCLWKVEQLIGGLTAGDKVCHAHVVRFELQGRIPYFFWNGGRTGFGGITTSEARLRGDPLSQPEFSASRRGCSTI